MTSPAPPSSPDEAAVEAANQLVDFGYCTAAEHARVAQKITDAYAEQGIHPLVIRLTAERAVREKLVEALYKAEIGLMLCKPLPGYSMHTMPAVRAALAEAEKLGGADG